MSVEDEPGQPGNVYEYLTEVALAASKAVSSTSSMDLADAAKVHAQVALANAVAGLAAAIHRHGEGE